MKVRNGFVSNSSSSSFVVDKSYLAPYKKELLLNPIKFFETVALAHYEKENDVYNNVQNDLGFRIYLSTQKENLGFDEDDIAMWKIKEKDRVITFQTEMTNFDYEEYALWIGVPERAIRGKE